MLAMAILGAPCTAGAQQPAKVWRIGLFHVGLDHVPPSLDLFRQTLRGLGYEEGVNIRLDWRNLPDEEAARETAKEFARNRTDLIVAFENHTIRAVKAATAEIPVVFVYATEPVAAGFVKSLSRPGGNLTGFVSSVVSDAKQLELFKELVPRLSQVLVLVDPEDPVTPALLGEVRTASRSLKLKLVERKATTPAELERVFASIKPGGVGGVFPLSPNLRFKFYSLMIRRAREKRLPLWALRKEWVHQGALFSYAQDFVAVGRDVAVYVDKILKGAKPADLPVEQPTKFELVINLKTAKTLGIKIPQSVLIRADEVIQ
jgi:putative ABC transport system substrate-binding protein